MVSKEGIYMKVVILAGGLGTRISEESHLRPKPMIEIGGQPILWHIMKYYSSFGGTQIWQITQNNLTEFVNRCKGLCDKTYDINNVFLTVKNVCANPFDKEEKKRENKNLSDIQQLIY